MQATQKEMLDWQVSPAVNKLLELLETPYGMDNQQPSIYINIDEGLTTIEKTL